MERLLLYVEKRVQYFVGQVLNVNAYTDEQHYLVNRLRRPSRAFVAPGLVEGLTVTPGTDEVYVAPGTAMDARGRQIVLGTRRQVPLQEYRGKIFDLVIGYADEASDADSDKRATRWWEKPYIGPRQQVPVEVTDWLVLAQVEVDKDTGQVRLVLVTGRQMAGLQGPVSSSRTAFYAKPQVIFA